MCNNFVCLSCPSGQKLRWKKKDKTNKQTVWGVRGGKVATLPAGEPEGLAIVEEERYKITPPRQDGEEFC